MKIAIMTLRLHKNYGGILQNYALNKVLTDMGHDVKTINIVWDIRLRGFRKYLVWIKRLMRNILCLKWSSLDVEGQILKQNPIVTQYTTAFKIKNIPLTKKVYYIPYADFSDINDNFDAVVVGSDQVWRPKYAHGIERYFLKFITNDNIKRIAYSVSFGTDENEYTNHEQLCCGELIKKFKAVSVREKEGIKLIKEKLKWNVDVTWTLDPTLLLRKNDYLKFIGNYQKTDKVFLYILDNTVDKQKVVKQVEQELVSSSFTLTPEGVDDNSTLIIPPVEEWLKAIISSRFVITDSFHGCVFSILFNTPFLVYGNDSRGKSRFDSLLEMVGLEERYIESFIQLKNRQIIGKSIDWDKVNKSIEEQKKISRDFLIDALS